jgi:transposase-like protein
MFTRTQIIQILEGELNAIEDRDTEDNAQLHHVLNLLIAGLKALEGGEVPPLFDKRKVTAKGKWPAKVRKQRFLAIGAVKALVKAGYKVWEATEIVAKSHGVSPDAVRQWRKTLGKDTDVEAQALMSLLPSRYTLFGWTKEGLLKAVEQSGKALRDAQQKQGK